MNGRFDESMFKSFNDNSAFHDASASPGSDSSVEERLEDLRASKHTWGKWMEEQNFDSSDDEDDEYEAELDEDDLELIRETREKMRSTRSSAQAEKSELEVKPESGLLKTTFWSFLAVLGLPVVVLLQLTMAGKQRSWPLGTSSPAQYLAVALSNVASLSIVLGLFYWHICGEAPEFDLDAIEECQVQWSVHRRELRRNAVQCINSALTITSGDFVDSCSTLVPPVVAVFVFAFVLSKYYRSWVKQMLLTLVGAALIVWAWQNGLGDLPPAIEDIDPQFAIVDEEIVILVDGSDLQEGGKIAWAPYWACAAVSPAESCDMLYSNHLEMGQVHVTFSEVDHYIPCYKPPVTPSSSLPNQYYCNEEIRLRVKDKKSVPGWSMQADMATRGEQALKEVSDLLTRTEQQSMQELQALKEATTTAISAANLRLQEIEEKAQKDLEEVHRTTLAEATNKATEEALRQTGIAIEKAKEMVSEIERKASESLQEAKLKSDADSSEIVALKQSLAGILANVSHVEESVLEKVREAEREAREAREVAAKLAAEAAKAGQAKRQASNEKEDL